jgi:hypothetical protein
MIMTDFQNNEWLLEQSMIIELFSVFPIENYHWFAPLIAPDNCRALALALFDSNVTPPLTSSLSKFVTVKVSNSSSAPA